MSITSYIWKIFKKSILATSIVVSLAISASFFELQGGYDVVLFGRIILGAAVMYLFYCNKKRKFPYYRNLGLSKTQIMFGISILDFVISLVIISTAYAIII